MAKTGLCLKLRLIYLLQMLAVGSHGTENSPIMIIDSDSEGNPEEDSEEEEEEEGEDEEFQVRLSDENVSFLRTVCCKVRHRLMFGR